MIHLFFIFALLLCFLPLLPGMVGLLLPSLSWIPTLGFDSVSISAFYDVATWPNLSASIALSLSTGLGSTVLALFFTYTILKRYWGTSRWLKLERTLSPMLAMPHVAFAIGFSLLFSPTGWVFRLIGALGISDVAGIDLIQNNLIQDNYGIGLMLALAIKETPFLIIMSIPILKQLNVEQLSKVSASLGYSHLETWRKVIIPQWLPKLRLPLFAVAAYGLSVVDIALILGPTRPATLSVLVWQWFNDPDLQQLPRAAAGASLLLFITAASLGLIRLVEWLSFKHQRGWITKGAKAVKNAKRNPIRHLALYSPFIAIPVLIVPLLFVWSFAHRWRFPDLLPSRYSERFWLQELPTLTDLISTSLLLAFVSSALALILVIACLEYRQKFQRALPAWLIAIPLVTPQLSLLFGIQIVTYIIPGQHYWLWVSWSHLIFVFPYMYLALDGAWRSYDVRLDQCSRSLGLTAWQTWWRVKRAQVQPAIIFGLAIGISVSLAQYLPTQMLGAGRISTLTTEAVALASGQDRRVMAIYGLLQGILPFIFFTLAIVANRLSYRWRHYRQYSLQNTHISNKSKEYTHG
ncbi:thiamine ABC transporter permease [Photobacterium gaetbulicola]|uniref:Putative ABC transporter, permeaseprotein n=1 Tax=Photobacterium gaetbulicola Gung47 TaxID=658445 RepID=A0A0C5WBH3_9GAMM|nr:thiamine ABC transporter permease [Photobacterium gaetbulicola]AJR08971.1 putative ABC transporter, permeaseprotein [Photobacterium gaetbulicola Gung47]PSU13527.1 thiamine ABC transporter permease [Photobacterium gaetbulicola]